MKRIMFKAMLAGLLAMLATGSAALSQEVEIPVIFDRSYLETGGMFSRNDVYNLDLHKREIAISPDGQMIAFMADRVYEIWIVSIEGGEPICVYSTPDDQLFVADGYNYGKLSSISFTPDGTEITFCRSYYDPEKGSAHELIQSGIGYNGVFIPTIESVNITTGEVSTLVEEGSAPSWSSDGRLLSYVHYDHRANTDPDNAEHDQEAAILDLMTGETRFLNEICTEVILTEDNTEAICSHPDNFVRITLETGERTVLPVKGGNSLTRVPGTSFILYDERVELEGWLQLNSILDPGSGSSVWAILGMSAQSFSGCLTPDGNSIIYLKEYLFTYTRENGGSVNGNSTMICRQPIDVGMRFAIGNIIEPPVIEQEYGILPEYGTLISDPDICQYVNNDMAWSPDGNRIAYSIMGLPAPQQIWSAPSTGGTSLLVYSVPSIEYQGATIKPGFLDICGYTPDGKEILFSHATLDENRNSVPVVTIKEDGYYRSHWSNPLKWLYAVNIENGDVRTVVEGACFGLYSPDGKYLAYLIKGIRNTGDPFLEEHNSQIVVRSLQTGVETFLDVWEGNDFFFWTNDSAAIIAIGSSSSSNPNGYFRYPIDCSEPERILGYSGYSYFTSLSPVNNQLIAYVGPDQSIYIRNLAVGEPERLSPEVAGRFSNPVISPDGTKIACVIEYTGSDVGNPYETHKTTKVFVLDLTVPSDLTPTAVADAVPAPELLLSNHPNPFNPSTTISFSLPSADIARLDIYSLSGQKVRELVNGNATAGAHEVVWDGRNDGGMPLASGVYIARIAAGGHIATQRMLLMK